MKRKCPWKDTYTEEDVRKKIVENYEEAMEIEEIADRSGYNEKSVNRIILNFKGKKTFKRNKGAGRPKKLTSSDKIAISNCIRSKPWISCDKIKKKLNISASSQTVRRFIKSKVIVIKSQVLNPN